jgi:hypothetical protein
MNKNNTLIVGILVFAGLCALLSMAYSSNKAKQAAQVASIVATSTTVLDGSSAGSATAGGLAQKVYKNQNVEFSSPQLLVINVNSENQFIVSATENKKSSFVEVYIGKTGDCYMDFCKAPTQSTSVQNGVTWDFLGNPEHCDGKECSQPSALYRTKTATKDIYLAFFEYGPHLNKSAIFSSFVVK